MVVSFPFDAANDKLKKSKSQYVKAKKFLCHEIEAVMDDGLTRGNVTLHPTGLLSDVMITGVD
ncbi:MAG: hypothetical protein IKO05_02595 [Selenomonadaceae bacterium]|nr:hypothetical protein [Selenomonadaceae bacterium]